MELRRSAVRVRTQKQRRLAIFHNKACDGLQNPNGEACALWGAAPWILIVLVIPCPRSQFVVES